MNIIIDDAIYRMQKSGGISTLWRELTPVLQATLPDFTFDKTQAADVFISTYYQPAPASAKSIAVVYDFIHERYPGLSRFAQDAQWKHAAIAAADAVIAISQWTADDVKQFTGKAVTVAYPATTLERASHETVQAFKAKYNLPDQYVLIMGRRGLYKNVNAYRQAEALIQSSLFTLFVGGEDLISSGRHYRHLRLNDDEMAAAYTGALCLVYPSLYEGFGLPVLEAYACGCPVICGSGGALAEINEAARVVDVTRPREIAEALVTMHDHSVRIEHIVQGYRAVKRFSWSSMAESMAAVIRGVVEEIGV